MKNSYNKSPLKLEDGEEKGTTSVEKKPVRVGKYAATKTTTSVREVKKSATGAKVEATPGMAKRYKKARPKGWSDEKLAAHNKRKRAAWDAQDKKAMAAKPEATGKVEEQMAAGNKVNVELEKAVGSPGTRSSTFHPWEQRQQNRREKIVKRQERQMGRQELRRDFRSMKNSAEWGKMKPEERKAAEYEFKHGRTKDQTTSNLERFGKDFAANVEQSRKRKEGQGELNKAQVRQEIERPGEATTTQMDQNLKGARRGDVSGTANYGDVQKKVEAGGPVELSAEDQKSLENERVGTRIEKVTSSNSKETPVARTNTPNSDTNIEKSTNKFAEMIKKKDEVLSNKPSDFKSKLAKPEAKPTAETKFGRGEKMLEEETPLKMRKSNFSLKGFGSKSGYNFNKNK